MLMPKYICIMKTNLIKNQNLNLYEKFVLSLVYCSFIIFIWGV